MVMCIISACLCLPLLILSAINLAILNGRRSKTWAGDYSSYSFKLEDVLQVSLSAVEVFISLLAAALTIASSAMACRAVCCRRPKAAGLPVVYNAGGVPAGFTLESLLVPGSEQTAAGGNKENLIN